MKISKIYIGADHAGFKLKERIKQYLIDRGYDVHDVSLKFIPEDDYPKYGKAVAQAVAKDKEARGVLICGTGVGVSIAANRVKGARAFDAHTADEARLAREHNDANIIALSGWEMKLSDAMKLIRVFLKEPFADAERHHRRVKQL
ncbi:MAG: RpiB/LacA/LacB family sugar-phosphate isomerase, partial [Patescibacteria group bacterium]